MPPLCPASSRGEPTTPDVGDQSTPVISSRMKLRSMTPFDDVSGVKCMVLPFGIALFRRSRRHLRLSLDREHEWEHPHGYCVHGSLLLARCHGLAHAINLKRIPSNPFSCPPTRPTVDTLACVSHPPRRPLNKAVLGLGGPRWKG